MLRPLGLLLLLAAAFQAATAAAQGGVDPKLKLALQRVTRSVSRKYNCSVSIGLRTSRGSVTAVGGIADFSTGRLATDTDSYAWGSVTKMLTGASIMKLASTGALSLDDEIGPLVDPILGAMAERDPAQNFSSVAGLWGAEAARTTVRQLLAMQSGIPDFDTANPNFTSGISRDPLRAVLYSAPDHSDTPPQLMGVPWVAHKFRECEPFPGMNFSKFCYSSTNFMLLGLALAAKAGESSWSALDQSAFLPPAVRGDVRFANRGSPRNLDAVHGYDRTSYNMPKGEHSDHDNWEVSGVFSGWTASNLVATPAAVAELTWQIFGPPKGVAPEEFVDKMIPGPMAIYGLAAFNIGFQTGHAGSALGVGYGHLGATYGYQSVTGYFPELNIVLSIATNIETDDQAQPSDALCLAYNAVAGILQGRVYSCQYAAMGYYGGRCVCKQAATDIVV